MLCYRCGTHNTDSTAQCSACGQVFQQQAPRAKSAAAPTKQGPYSSGIVVADRYRVDSVIGSGPVGVVYRVTDLQPTSDDALALKVLQPRFLQTSEDRAAFMRALQRSKKMIHPGIAKVLGEGEDASRVFFVMQFINGTPLSRILDRPRPFSLAECEPLVSQICSALEYAHRFTAHGALKPDNIIVRPDEVRLTDFMMLRGLPRRPYITAMGATQLYCAPELRKESADVLPAADIYSLGVIVGEMLTGARGEALPNAIRSLPAEVARLLLKATDPIADNRHRSPNEFLNELLGLLDDEPITDAPMVSPPPMPNELTINEMETSLVGMTPQESTVSEEPVAVLEAKKLSVSAPPPSRKKKEPSTKPVSLRLQLDEEPAFRKKKSSGNFRMALVIVLLCFGATGVGLALQKPEHKPAEAKTETAPALPPPAPPAEVPPKPAPEKVDTTPTSVTAGPRVERTPTRTKRSSKPTAGLVEIISGEDLPVSSNTPDPAPAPAVAPAPEPKGCPSGMIMIPAGRTIVGTASSDELRNFSDRPLTSAEVKAFCVDKYEYPNAPGVAPTVNVSLRQAKQMCEASGKRLCMEDEWERACKGPIGSRFPYGKDFDEAACNVGTENVKTAGASPRCKSGFGAVDMSGNVAEWTDSRMSGTDFVVKGGDASHPDYASRCASRTGMSVARKATTVGFRCCSSME